MAMYVILTRLQPGAYSSPKDLKSIARDVAGEIKQECPAVQWKYSYATMGRWDVVDVVESDDPRQVEKAAMIIRARGKAMTETMQATPWHDFIDAL